MKYPGNDIIGKSYRVTLLAPFDARLVQSKKSDLIDPTKFGGDLFTEYRYQGMIVSVIEDEDTNNNGIYYLQGTNPNLLESWVKIGSGDSFSWPDPPEDYDPNKRYYLDWNNGDPTWKLSPTKLSELEDVDVNNASYGDVLKWNGTEWIAAPDERGSGSGSGFDGVTEEDIDYHLVFTPTNQGGLGYSPTPSSTRGLGYLKPTDYPNSVIPAGTSYQEIFEKILVGEEQLDVTVNNLIRTYTGSNFDFGTPTPIPSSATIEYSLNGSSGWSTTKPTGKINAGTYTIYVRSTKDGKTSSSKQQTLKINPATVVLKTNNVGPHQFDGEEIISTGVTKTCEVAENLTSLVSVNDSILNKRLEPGVTIDSYQYTNNDSSNIQVQTNWGTLTVTSLVKYSIDLQGNSKTVVTNHSPILKNGQEVKVDGDDPDILYIDGKSGITSDSIDHRFRIYVYGNQIIDTDNIWGWNDNIQNWEKTSIDAAPWNSIQITSTNSEMNSTTRIYTFSNKDASITPTEIPYEHVYVAFKVKNN